MNILFNYFNCTYNYTDDNNFLLQHYSLKLLHECYTNSLTSMRASYVKPAAMLALHYV